MADQKVLFCNSNGTPQMMGDSDTIPLSNLGLSRASLTDLGTRSASDLNSGNLDPLRLPTGGTWSLTGNLLFSGSVNYGFGTDSPGAKVDILSTSAQLYLSYSGSIYTSFAVNSAGFLTIKPTGSNVYLWDTASGGVFNVYQNNSGGIRLYDTRTNIAGNVILGGKDSASNLTSYAIFGAGVTDNTDGAEKGYFYVSVMNSGSVSEALRITYDRLFGFGTTTPSNRITLEGTTYQYSSIKFLNTASGINTNYWTVGENTTDATTNSFSIEYNGSSVARFYGTIPALSVGSTTVAGVGRFYGAATGTDALMTDTSVYSVGTFPSSFASVFANQDAAAVYSGFALQTRLTNAAVLYFLNERQANYVGDLVIRGRTGASSTAELLRLKSATARLGLGGIVAPSSSLSFDGTTARSVGIERNKNTNSAGQSLSINAGGACNNMVSTASVSVAGTSYTVGDILTLAQPTDGEIATISVDTIDGSGGVATFSIVSKGSKYATGVKTTTGGTGTGCTINVLTRESATDANGGDLNLYAGVSTGTGVSTITLWASGGTVSGNTDNTLLRRLYIDGSARIMTGGVTTSTGSFTVYYTSTDALMTDSDYYSHSLATRSFLFYGVNGDNSANYSGIALQTRATGASAWFIMNEWQSSYVGDLVFRSRYSSGTGSREHFRIKNAGDIQLNGQAAIALGMSRNPTSDTAGNNLTLNAGGAASGATDKNGGDLNLKPGISTGTGKTSVKIYGSDRASSTGTSDNTQIERFITFPVVNLTDNTDVNLFEVALPALTGCAGHFEYSVTVSDGTDLQVHAGSVRYAAVNKAGTYTTSIVDESVTDAADAKSNGASTLSETWGIVTGTNKITIKANFNSSLTPTSMKLRLVLFNTSGQAITIL